MLKVFGVPVSVHTRKVILTAIIKKIPFEVEPVIPFIPPEGWQSLSPTGLIPAISHDGFENFESSAICAYFERISSKPSLYPAEAKPYSRALALEQYATNTLFNTVIQPLFVEKIIRPHMLNEGPENTEEVSRLDAEVAPGVFDFLEAQLGRRHFFVGDSLSIADFSVFANLVNYYYLGFRLDPARHPALSANFETALADRPMIEALAAEEPFATQMGLDRSFITQRANASV